MSGDNLVETASLDWDVETLSKVDLGSYKLPGFGDDRYIFGEYGQVIAEGGNRVEDPAFALLDLARKVRLDDGKTDESWKKAEEMIRAKGPRMGFFLATVFMNSAHEFDNYKQGDKERRDIISVQLQERMASLVESYLESIGKIGDEEAVLIDSDLFHLARVVGRSAVDVLDSWLSAKSIERDRQLGVPASDETYLNIDNLFRILKTVESFANKDEVKNNAVVEARVLSIVDVKKILEDKGVVF